MIKFGDAGHEFPVAGVRLVGEGLGGDLLFGHFEREKRRGNFLHAAHVRKDLFGQRGFAASGLAGNDDEFAGLDPPGAVHEGKPGLEAGIALRCA